MASVDLEDVSPWSCRRVWVHRTAACPAARRCSSLCWTRSVQTTLLTFILYPARRRAYWAGNWPTVGLPPFKHEDFFDPNHLVFLTSTCSFVHTVDRIALCSVYPILILCFVFDKTAAFSLSLFLVRDPRTCSWPSGEAALFTPIWFW